MSMRDGYAVIRTKHVFMAYLCVCMVRGLCVYVECGQETTLNTRGTLLRPELHPHIISPEMFWGLHHSLLHYVLDEVVLGRSGSYRASATSNAHSRVGPVVYPFNTTG